MKRTIFQGAVTCCQPTPQYWLCGFPSELLISMSVTWCDQDFNHFVVWNRVMSFVFLLWDEVPQKRGKLRSTVINYSAWWINFMTRLGKRNTSKPHWMVEIVWSRKNVWNSKDPIQRKKEVEIFFNGWRTFSSASLDVFDVLVNSTYSWYPPPKQQQKTPPPGNLRACRRFCWDHVWFYQTPPLGVGIGEKFPSKFQGQGSSQRWRSLRTTEPSSKKKMQRILAETKVFKQKKRQTGLEVVGNQSDACDMFFVRRMCCGDVFCTVLEVDQSCVFSRLSSTIAIFCLNGPTKLGGGFKHFLFSPLFGEDSHFD